MPEQPFDPDLARQVKFDSICLRFDQAWRQGEEPSIESFASEVPEEERSELLGQLLLLELEYVEKAGSCPAFSNTSAVFKTNNPWFVGFLNQHSRSSAEVKSSRSNTETADAAAEGPGTRIGRYKLLEQIGEGGMGTVYMAEQQIPVRRMVALKIIKPGMDTRQVVARFEAERQALAMMEHSNIARVLDGGSTDSGRPYFVMELVRGDSDYQVSATNTSCRPMSGCSCLCKFVKRFNTLIPKGSFTGISNPRTLWSRCTMAYRFPRSSTLGWPRLPANS